MVDAICVLVGRDPDAARMGGVGDRPQMDGGTAQFAETMGVGNGNETVGFPVDQQDRAWGDPVDAVGWPDGVRGGAQQTFSLPMRRRDQSFAKFRSERQAQAVRDRLVERGVRTIGKHGRDTGIFGCHAQ